MVSVIQGIMLDERYRLADCVKYYKEDIAALPAGSLVVKKIKGKEYLYRKYNEGGKQRSEYVGRVDSEEHRAMAEKIEARREKQAAVSEMLFDIATLDEAIRQVQKKEDSRARKKNRKQKAEE